MRVPLLPRYYQGAATPWVLPTSLGCPRSAVPLRCTHVSLHPAGRALPGATGFCFPRRLPAVGSSGGDHRASHVPEEPPLCLCPVLRPRQDRCVRPLRRTGMAPAQTTARAPTTGFRGSIARLWHWLSTPRRLGYPTTTQDSLPVVGQTLPDGLGYPQGSNERFPILRCIFLLSQALRDARLVRGPGRSSPAQVALSGGALTLADGEPWLTNSGT